MAYIPMPLPVQYKALPPLPSPCGRVYRVEEKCIQIEPVDKFGNPVTPSKEHPYTWECSKTGFRK